MCPNYKYARQLKKENIYLVPISISNLRDQDFSLGALEYRTNKLEQGIKELKVNSRRTKPNYFPF